MGFHRLLNEIQRSGSFTKAFESLKCISPLMEEVKNKYPERFDLVLRKLHAASHGPHYNEKFAREDVNKMFHVMHNGKRVEGEYFSISDVEQIKHNYSVPHSANIWDLYVALNATYHDKHEEFLEMLKESMKDNYENRERDKEYGREPRGEYSNPQHRRHENDYGSSYGPLSAYKGGRNRIGYVQDNYSYPEDRHRGRNGRWVKNDYDHYVEDARPRRIGRPSNVYNTMPYREIWNNYEHNEERDYRNNEHLMGYKHEGGHFKYLKNLHCDVDEQIIIDAIEFFFNDKDAPEGKVWLYMQAMKEGEVKEKHRDKYFV